jgi:Flp pilus assembly pilin Flp
MTIDRMRVALNETGQTMAEYCVVLSLIIVVTLVLFTSLGNNVESALNAVRAVFP